MRRWASSDSDARRILRLREAEKTAHAYVRFLTDYRDRIEATANIFAASQHVGLGEWTRGIHHPEKARIETPLDPLFRGENIISTWFTNADPDPRWRRIGVDKWALLEWLYPLVFQRSREILFKKGETSYFEAQKEAKERAVRASLALARENVEQEAEASKLAARKARAVEIGSGDAPLADPEELRQMFADALYMNGKGFEQKRFADEIAGFLRRRGADSSVSVIAKARAAANILLYLRYGDVGESARFKAVFGPDYERVFERGLEGLRDVILSVIRDLVRMMRMYEEKFAPATLPNPPPSIVRTPPSPSDAYIERKKEEDDLCPRCKLARRRERAVYCDACASEVKRKDLPSIPDDLRRSSGRSFNVPAGGPANIEHWATKKRRR